MKANKHTGTYRVTYTKKVGGDGSIMVKANDEAQALVYAKQLCFTGSEFRDAVKIDDALYCKPRKQGFAGRN